MEDQPSLKQIMDLLTQLQIQQSQTQLELASMKAALTGSPLREEQPVALQPLVGEEQSAPAETSSDMQFNCFQCGGEHHSQTCKVTSPTAEQKAAGYAAKEAFATAKRNKNINTNSTGITQNQLTVEPPDYAPEDVTSKLCSYRNFG